MAAWQRGAPLVVDDDVTGGVTGDVTGDVSGDIWRIASTPAPK